jgi:multidrug efflux pump subunit AcrA (membrane-fusion protein)
MKGVFFNFTTPIVLIIIIIVLGSCSIPKASFTFINNMSASTVEIVPASGEDWTGFTLAAGQTKILESENSNLFFSATIDGTLPANLSQYYTYNSGARTYTFTDIP